MATPSAYFRFAQPSSEIGHDNAVWCPLTYINGLISISVVMQYHLFCLTVQRICISTTNYMYTKNSAIFKTVFKRLYGRKVSTLFRNRCQVAKNSFIVKRTFIVHSDEYREALT